MEELRKRVIKALKLHPYEPNTGASNLEEPYLVGQAIKAVLTSKPDLADQLLAIDDISLDGTGSSAYMLDCTTSSTPAGLKLQLAIQAGWFLLHDDDEVKAIHENRADLYRRLSAPAAAPLPAPPLPMPPAGPGSRGSGSF
jgi:hypothetical protein